MQAPRRRARFSAWRACLSQQALKELNLCEILYRLWNEHGSLVQGFDMPIATEVCEFFQMYSYFAPRSLTKCFL